MRDIKFRGLTDNNGFVYGLISHDLPNTTAYYKTHSYRICWHTESGGTASQPVKNGTIGQFTGLHDLSGKEIYAGDILRIPAKDKWEEVNYSAFEVFYHDNDCCDSHVGYQMGRMHNFGSIGGGFCGYQFKPSTTAKFEVIGNIHEQEES